MPTENSKKLLKRRIEICILELPVTNQKNDISFILDCNGKFEKLWQFSAFVISKGCKVLEVSNSDNFIDITLTKTEYDAEHIFLRAIQKGKPEYTTYSLNGTERKAVRIDKHLYIPET